MFSLYDSVYVRERIASPSPYQYINIQDSYDWLLIGYIDTEGNGTWANYFMASIENTTAEINEVSLPSMVWLFAIGLVGLLGVVRRRVIL